MTVDPLHSVLQVAGAGLNAQSLRLRTISENIANAQSTGKGPGSEPYVRKTITFESEVDRASGVNLLRVRSIDNDKTPFRLDFDPSHPASDSRGYVKMPNVNFFIEMADLREANRSYQANLQTIKQAKELLARTIDLLKG